MIAAGSGFWTTTHIVIILDAILTVATLLTAWAALKSIQGSKSQLELLGEQVQLERDQLEQQSEVLRVSVMPLIADVPLGSNVETYSVEGTERFLDRGEIVWDSNDGEETIKISIPFRNIGSGPAFIHKIVFEPKVGVAVEGSARGGVVPVGEISYAFYYFSEGNEHHNLAKDWLATGRMKVGVTYADLGMLQRFCSVLDVVPLANHKFMVNRVRIFRCDEHWIPREHSFVESGGGWNDQP